MDRKSKKAIKLNILLFILTNFLNFCSSKQVVCEPDVSGIVFKKDTRLAIVEIYGKGSQEFHRKLKNQMEHDLVLSGIKTVKIWQPEWMKEITSLGNDSHKIQSMYVPHQTKADVLLVIFIEDGEKMNDESSMDIKFIDSKSFEIIYDLKITGTPVEISKKVASMIIEENYDLAEE